MTKKLTAIILAMLLLSPASLYGCSESMSGDTGTESTSVSTSSSTDDTETDYAIVNERETAVDSLPSDLDYEGANLQIIARQKEWFKGETYVEELNGEVLNDAVYNRDLTVENRLNVNIDYVLDDGIEDAVSASVKSDSDDYQIVIGSAVNQTEHGVNGEYYNLLGEYPANFDEDAPWWSQYYLEQAEINGKVFFATGDLCFSLTKLAFATFANLQMVENLQLENPYDVVREGKWTFDKVMEMSSGAYVDYNGNGKKDDGDMYGFAIAGSIQLDSYWSAFDISICSRDADGVPYFSIDQEKMNAALDMLIEAAYETQYVYNTEGYGNDSEQDDITEMFAKDVIMFTTLRILHADSLRNMESDYGILPLPKFNEEQSEYYTYVHDQYSIVGIPVSVKQPEMASAVLEALAVESYKFVSPAYYDYVLHGKYLRDKDSSEMLELVMENVKIDIGWIYTYSLGDIAQHLLRKVVVDTKRNNFSTLYAAKSKLYTKYVEKMVDKIDDIDY